MSLGLIAGMAMRATLEAEQGVMDPSPFPERLSIWPSHPDYHPSYCRIGVRFNGELRNDVQWYNLASRQIRLNKTNELLEGDIELYWRYMETRQQRRAREAWEKKRGR